MACIFLEGVEDKKLPHWVQRSDQSGEVVGWVIEVVEVEADPTWLMMGLFYDL